MRFLIFGAGALGGLIGALLSKRNDVTLVGRKEHISRIEEEGLRISGMTDLLARPTVTGRVEGTSNYDFIFLTVKSYDTRSAMKELSNLGECPVITVQNGLGNLETMGESASAIVGGTTSHGATLKGPGEVIHAGTGDTVIGAYKGVSRKTLDILAGELTACGIETYITENLAGEIWAKAVVNAGINPLTAILGAKNGYLLRNPAITGMLETACLEAVEVAKAWGVSLPKDDLVERTKKVARRTAENMSSMLQDIMRQKRTEIDSITGEIVRLGEKKGVRASVNSTLLAIVKGIESSYGV
ncbi:MAG: ketopantoate reductase family protein [Thermoplasmata archaeon]